jgi:hypothetical protein
MAVIPFPLERRRAMIVRRRVLEIAANNSSLVRGRSAIGIIGTEISFWETSDTVVPQNNDER